MRLIALALLLVVSCSALRGQWSATDSLLIAQCEFAAPPDSILMLDSIIILGNTKTKPYVVIREMETKPGDMLTSEAMSADRSRIENLGLFNRVDIGYLPDGEGRAILVVVVHERWYLYPFPIAGIKDRDWKKLYFGAGLMHQNFRGRNEKLFAAFVLGYDPAVMISYRNPMIDDELNHFLEVGLAWRVVRNRSLVVRIGNENFDERHFSVGLTFGRRFSIANTAWVGLSFNLIRVADYRIGRTIDADGEDAFPALTAGYVYDTRDLADYATDGTFIRSTITKFGIPGNPLDIIRYAIDMRRFVPLVPRISLAGRVFSDLAVAGQTPSYNRVFLGYDQRIRGHFTEVHEGENQFGASMELRFTLLTPKYFALDFIPIPEFAVWKFGLFASLFVDAGTVWFRGEPFARDRFVSGYGAGLNFLLPYGFLLRTEFARNESRRGEFILDFTSTF